MYTLNLIKKNIEESLDVGIKYSRQRVIYSGTIKLCPNCCIIECTALILSHMSNIYMPHGLVCALH